MDDSGLDAAETINQYDTLDWVMIILSALIIIVYHVVRRHSLIGVHQDTIWHPWAEIMERTSKNSITAVQMLRNIMTIQSFLGGASITGATLLASLREDGLIPAIEMSVVLACYIVAFLNFALCCRVIHHLTLLISLYPADLNQDDSHQEEIRAYSEANKKRVRNLLTLLGRHNAIGRRLLIVALPVTMVIFSRIALFASTFLSLFVWIYMDTRFGTRLGGKTVDELDAALNKKD